MLAIDKFRKPIAARGFVPQLRNIAFDELHLAAERFHLERELIELDGRLRNERIARDELHRGATRHTREGGSIKEIALDCQRAAADRPVPAKLLHTGLLRYAIRPRRDPKAGRLHGAREQGRAFDPGALRKSTAGK